jgi:hypothetical protein
MMINPPGWYTDPFQRAETRWWSGSAWTEHVGTNGQSFVDPPGEASHSTVPQAPAPAMAPAAAPQVAYAPQATPAPAAASARSAASKKLAIVGVVALLAGGVAGYVLRGDGGGTTSGGGASSGTLATPLLQGLASLDSYGWSLNSVTVGPTAQDRSEMAGQGQVDAALGASHYSMTTTDTSADDPESSTSTTENWTSKDATCANDAGVYTKEVKNPFESDLGPVLSGLFDIVVPSGDATMVGTEDIAGISAKHYTFTIKGLGAGTGAQVDQNSGELWVAVDGGYLLKYTVNASMTSGPAGAADTQINSMTMTLELTSVNQPVDVTMPAACV